MTLALALEPPVVSSLETEALNVKTQSGIRSVENNWYRQNEFGIWEAYVEGEAYERGLKLGVLAEGQVVSQEESFVAQIKKLVPSEWFLKTLKYGVVFFNRNLPDHISLELQKEIYGVSRSFSDEYDFIGDKYSRILNYHAAHDVGHALQDLSIVGCSSFAVWDEFSADSSLVVARNFDFYMGDEFAKDKMVLFLKPDSGYAFASITWAGFMGVVSGMNEHGLTVTLNAAKSAVPNGAKTPISLLAREILQYAKTIDEAFEIAKSRETFVSESILISSASDRSAVVIEKSPEAIDIYRSIENQLVCTNHYQSKRFKNDSINLKNIQLSDSQYRFQRLEQLIDSSLPISENESVDILRNQKGIDESDLGMGNPKALNQLLAHHGVVFKPEERLMWVSANPFQLGAFVCYDLNAIFGDSARLGRVDSLTIDKDSFLKSSEYQSFLKYKQIKNDLFGHIVLGDEIEWNSTIEEEFIASNPESYITYWMLGDYYLEQDDLDKALGYFELSLSKEVASKQEEIQLQEKIKLCRSNK